MQTTTKQNNKQSSKQSNQFKYEKELKKLLSLDCISLEPSLVMHLGFTNYQYENILKPLYNWISSMKALNKLNFNIIISNNHNKLVIKPCTKTSTTPVDMQIPCYVKNIVLDANLLENTINTRNLIITYANYKSIIINKDTYKTTVRLAANKILYPSKELYEQIEKIGRTYIKEIGKLLKSNNESRLLRIYNNLQPLYLFNIIETHMQMIGNPISLEEASLIKKDIQIMKTEFASQKTIETIVNSLETYLGILKQYKTTK